MVKFASLRCHAWPVTMVSRDRDILFAVDFVTFIPYAIGESTQSPDYAVTSKTKRHLMVEASSFDYLLIFISDDLIRFGDGMKIQNPGENAQVHWNCLLGSFITSVGHLSISIYILHTPTLNI